MKTKLLLICIAMLAIHTYGQFSEQKTISTLADEARSVYAVDLDGDGDIDVLSASFRDDKIAWYENTDGKGTFTTQLKIAIDVDGATSVYAADLDGDGDVDVLSASQNDGKIAWFENTDGKGNFGAQKRVTNDAKGASSVFAADFDGDGKMDVLFASRSENRIAWHKNVDNQPWDFGDQQIITKEAMGAASVYAVDIDGDGDMDVLSASTGDNTIAWYENTDSKGTFSDKQIITINASVTAAVYAADIDGDGDVDVLSAAAGDDQIAWYENTNGKGSFGAQQVISILADSALSVYAADVDDDGDIDVLSASQNDNKIAWYENIDGQGNFGTQQIITSSADGANSVFAADIDGDGKLDVLSASKNDDKIAWYQNLTGPKTYVPDNNFEQALIDLGYDTVLDDYVPTANISTITSLKVSGKNIADLTGIEDFSALTLLWCFNNQLTSLDLSQNTALTYLRCGRNQLTSIDVSKNTVLAGLRCDNNQLTSLDLNQNVMLTDLRCQNNQLTNIDLSQNVALSYLHGINNQLINLDLSQNVALKELYCSTNQLTSLDVSQNIVLTILHCQVNQLTSLNVKNGINTNFNNFTAQSNPNLTCIQVDNAAWSTANWTNIDATSTFSEDCNAALTYVPDDNFEQALIDKGYDTVLDDYVPTANISTITSLNISNKNIADLTGIEDFVALQELRCHYNELTSLDMSQNTALTFLSCHNNQLTNLDVSQQTALTKLFCTSNQLSSLDLSKNTALTDLHCNINQLSSLDLNQNLALTDLYCSENQLTSLYVSENIVLEKIACHSNQLSSLDLSQNTTLIRLWCYSNQLTSLNVKNGNNTNLGIFQAYNNPNLTCIEVDDATWSITNWTSIDATSIFSEDCNAALTYIPDDNFEQALIDKGYDTVLDDYVPTANINAITHLTIPNKNIADLTGIEGFTALKELRCYGNQLGNLDISQNRVLTYLNCAGNQLTSLDLTQNTALTILTCSYNQLSNLEIIQNIALDKLQCIDNKLTTLNVNQNTALTQLFCHDNQLTSLDVSQNTVLTSLWCNNNQLTGLNVKNSNNINFTSFKAQKNPNLTCIEVDDAAWSAANWVEIDATSTFVNSQADCDVLAVSDEVLNNAIVIYPNPAKAIFKIKAAVNISKINIFDSLGRMVLQFNQQENYNISNLTKGIYFIRLKSDEKSYQQKLIIQ